MSSPKQSAKTTLIGAIAVLGASVGAVSTAYAEPVQLSGAQMDGITAGGGEVCTTCAVSLAPTITRGDLASGSLLINWGSTDLPAVNHKEEINILSWSWGASNVSQISINTDSILIKKD